jgi:hypothetical protein
MWSDKSGRHSATKESIRLPSSAWQWTADWTIDYYTPGGVDKYDEYLAVSVVDPDPDPPHVF